MESGDSASSSTFSSHESSHEEFQPNYSRLLKSVEAFAQGNATVSDVIKDLYTETARNDQFWKGALVGAAAAVLLTSEPVKQGMGKTFASMFGQGEDKNSSNASSRTSDDLAE